MALIQNHPTGRDCEGIMMTMIMMMVMTVMTILMTRRGVRRKEEAPPTPTGSESPRFVHRHHFHHYLLILASYIYHKIWSSLISVTCSNCFDFDNITFPHASTQRSTQVGHQRGRTFLSAEKSWICRKTQGEICYQAKNEISFKDQGKISLFQNF